MASKIPDRINIRKNDRENYKELQKQEPFKGKTNKEIFMMAMAIGFHVGNRIKFCKGEKEGWFLLKDLNDEEKSIIYGLAINEEGLNILLEMDKIYSITEEYANGGIKILKDKIFSGDPGSYIKKLETELVNILKKIK